MTRRRVLSAAAVAVLIAVVLGGVLLASGGDDGPRPDDGGPVGAAYARAWNATCAALAADAGRTTSTLRGRLGDRTPSVATRRRLARAVVAPYLGRTERRLTRLQRAVPPAAWQAYHRTAVAELRRAVARTAAARTRVRAGDLTALGDLDPTATGAAPPAPPALRERTPACSASAGA